MYLRRPRLAIDVWNTLDSASGEIQRSLAEILRFFPSLLLPRMGGSIARSLAVWTEPASVDRASGSPNCAISNPIARSTVDSTDREDSLACIRDNRQRTCNVEGCLAPIAGESLHRRQIHHGSESMDSELRSVSVLRKGLHREQADSTAFAVE